MSERDIGQALLRGEEPIDLHSLTDGVLRRDRRRMWLLGTLCVIAWMAVVLLPWATIMPMLAKVGRYQDEANRAPAAAAPQQQAQTAEMLEAVRFGTIATFVSSVASMFVAAVCTVLLIVLSRRATLRQINARLAVISGQLKAAGGGR